MDTGYDLDELHCRDYHSSIERALLLSADRTRPLNPRELARLLLLGDMSPEYVHAIRRRQLPADIR